MTPDRATKFAPLPPGGAPGGRSRRHPAGRARVAAALLSLGGFVGVACGISAASSRGSSSATTSDATTAAATTPASTPAPASTAPASTASTAASSAAAATAAASSSNTPVTTTHGS